MAIALGLDPAWTGGTGSGGGLASAAFSPVAGSLIVVDAHLDDVPGGGHSVTCTDSTGALTWTQIGPVAVGSTGGFACAFWAYTASARTNMTVTVTWDSNPGGRKEIKPTTYTGTAVTSAVIAKQSGSSATNNLTVNSTNTNNGCRIHGTAVDWQALGTPTSTDDETAYDATSLISGLSVHKASNTTGTAQTVPLNFDAAGSGTPVWAYITYEIVPAGDVQVTPAVIAVVAATPAPTPAAGQTVSPAKIAAVAATPAPTLSTGTGVTPAKIAVTAATPAPALSTGMTVAAAVVHATAALPAPAVRTGSTVSPAAVAVVVAFPGSTTLTGGGATVTPSAIAVAAALPAPVKSAGSTVSPAAIAVVVALPLATKRAGTAVTPATITTLVAMPAPTITNNAARVYTRLSGQLVTVDLRGVVRINGAPQAIG